MLENCHQSAYRSVELWWNFFLTLPIISMAVSYYYRAHLNSPPQNYSDFNSDVDATKVFIALRKTWKASLLFARCRLVPKIIFFDFFKFQWVQLWNCFAIFSFLHVWALLWQHSILVSNKFSISMILNLLTMPRTVGKDRKPLKLFFCSTPKVFFYSVTYVWGFILHWFRFGTAAETRFTFE